MRIAANRRQRRALRQQFNAAEHMRKQIKRANGACCASCRVHFAPSFLDVDHMRPLAAGGYDVVSNVQALCRPCHRIKTLGDFR